MSNLIEELRSLSEPRARRVLVALCSLALETWDNWIAKRPNLSYVESVVGTSQKIDPSLPGEALDSVNHGGQGAEALSQRYLEPLSALQDDDLEWEKPVEFAYYAVYNLFRKYALFDEVDPWLIANQALSALPQVTDLRKTLQSALARAIDE